MSQPYARVYNFSAGPGTLPVPVLEQARDQLLNYNGAGMSVMEMSHRGKVFEKIIEEAEVDLRTLMGIPNSYRVLFLQGGASLQFTMVPMNLLPPAGTADFVVTGSWGEKAIQAASLVGCTRAVYNGKENGFRSTPDLSQLTFSPDAAYVHITSNETIQGVEYPQDPKIAQTLVCDMSSDILSRECTVENYALIYAGAQKNMGPAGVTVVILREDVLERVPKDLPPMLDLRLQAENRSLYNTPPCWSIYVCGLVYKYLLKQGGLAAMAKANARKAQIIYDAIDGSGGFYIGHAEAAHRSRMNITFNLARPDLTDRFVSEAALAGMVELKGHRSVGGVRASVYNAFPADGCLALADFMRDFAQRNG
jgi:phosphoserine aminotransferase